MGFEEFDDIVLPLLSGNLQGGFARFIFNIRICAGINKDSSGLFIGYIMKGCTTIVLPRVNACAVSDEGLGERFVIYEVKCLQ